MKNDMLSNLSKLFLITGICSFLLLSCRSDKKEVQKGEPLTDIEIPALSRDEYFDAAYAEMAGILDGKQEYDFKRAVFLTEWAYYRGNLNYDNFCDGINRIADALRKFIRQKNIQQYRTSGNFALFEFFTQPNFMNGNEPYSYDFEDFAGTLDPSKTFITKLLDTHSGQCRSLPTLYKILAEEIGAEAYLAQAPNHLYIKHLDEDNRWVNVELTNGSFSTDAYIISSMFISAEAIRNGVYMEALTMEQSIAFYICELANIYSKVYGYDEFVVMCCDKSLEYYPANMSALITKHNATRELGLEYQRKVSYRIDSTSLAHHDRWRETKERIEELGFREMPNDAYEEWVRSVEREKERVANAGK